MPELSDIQSSQEELQDYYPQLRAQHVTPAWIGGGISIEPQSKAVRAHQQWRPRPAFLFSFSDAPVMKALSLYREETRA
jgi:gentisate 1,2-dioxygenase